MTDFFKGNYLSQYDEIKLNNETFKTIESWTLYKLNEEESLLNNLKLPFPTAVFHYNKEISFIYKETSSSVIQFFCTVYAKPPEREDQDIVFEVSLSNPYKPFNVKATNAFTHNKKVEVILIVLSIFYKTIFFMNEYKEVKGLVREDKVRDTSKKKVKKGKKKKTKVKLLRRRITFNTKVLEKERSHHFDFKRHKKNWTVRGHWRQLKSGKRIWVKSHTKGDLKEKKEGKVYEL